MNAPTAFAAVYAVESEAAALAEIIKLLPALSAKGHQELLRAQGKACKLSSAERDDDLWITGVRVDECAESLRDELGGEIETDDSRYNCPRAA